MQAAEFSRLAASIHADETFSIADFPLQHGQTVTLRLRRFEVLAGRVDAWNRFPNVAVGAVYLRRVAADKVEAINVICPHAGCPVDYRPGGKGYLCPCHDSQFNFDGTLVAGARSPSPRGLDALEVEVREGSEIWVKFQNFEAGKAEKVPVT